MERCRCNAIAADCWYDLARTSRNRLTARKMLFKRFYTPASCLCSSPSTSSELLPERDVQPPEDVLTGWFVSRFVTQLGRRNASMSVTVAEVYLDHFSKQLLDKHISGKSVGPNTPEMSFAVASYRLYTPLWRGNG
jgi:hypothetical protein